MEDSVGETPTGATGTVALPRKSLMIGVLHSAFCISLPPSRCYKRGVLNDALIWKSLQTRPVASF